MRTAQEIVEQTNELAREFYAMRGYEVPKGYRFDKARHPDERGCWAMACAAQLTLTDTDVEDVMEEVETEAEPEPEQKAADEKRETGWGNPRPFDPRSKFHYFADNGMALCGKWARFAGSPEVEEGNDDHKDNCAACKKVIAKYRSAATAAA